MRPARIILLLVALVAGSLAAFLVTRGSRAPAPTTEVVTQVVEEAKAQILVAKTPIGVGERLNSERLEWQDWPEGALRPEYVTIAAMPDAPAQLTGAVARFEIFPGEPIREAKLVRADQGYLSAVLASGKRGVSVTVTAACGVSTTPEAKPQAPLRITRTAKPMSSRSEAPWSRPSRTRMSW